MKAINTFDLSLNNKFSSYATTCIWHEMINCIAASTVVTNWKNFSSGIRDMVLPVARSLDCEVPQNHNDNPNYRQTYKDILVDNDSDGGLSYLITKNEYDYIVNLMDKEEKKLIDYIYKDRLTLEEVGEIYNLTKQGVHVRLKKIFGEIRNILNSKKYY